MQTSSLPKIKRVIVSGGGTGGHIFPAISIANAIKVKYPEVEILFVGALGRMEMTRIPQAGYPIEGLPIEGLDRKRWWRNFSVIKNFILSYQKAKALVRQFTPDIVIGVGGYASAPTLRAAQALGIPTLIQEQNSYAGLSNKFLARHANKICVAYPNMERFFPKDKIVITGNPIRPEIEQLSINRDEALKHFGFTPSEQKIVLVIGGSLGAKTINESIALHLEAWATSGVRLIWQTGRAYEAQAQELLYNYRGEVYCSAFIERMDWAYGIADLVVSRAGASSISELCCLGKPTILVPSPNVAEDHQTKNALALSQRGAAILIKDSDAREQLTHTALTLITKQDKLQALGEQAQQLYEGNSAMRIVQEIEQLL